MRLSTLTSISENLSNASIRFGNSLDKLGSGIKVNKASDDGSGLAISDKLRTQVTSIRSAIDNGNSAIAMLQIADKSMAEQSKILDSIKAKLIQASTDTTSADGRVAIQKDINKLLAQLDNIASQTNYNGRQLISSSNALSAANTHTFQLGEKSSDSINTTAIYANTSGLPNVSEAKEVLNANVIGAGTVDSNVNGNIIGTLGFAEAITINGDVDGNILTLLGGTGSRITINGNVNGDISATLSGTGSYIIINGNVNGNMSATLTGTGSRIVIDGTLTGVNTNNNVGTGAMTSILNNSYAIEETALRLLDLKNLNTLSQENAKTYQQIINDSITKLNSYRSDIGSTQNQVQSAVRNLMTQATNLEAAKSTIIDVDYASESAIFNKEMIILSAGQFSLTQANTYQSSILSLLQ